MLLAGSRLEGCACGVSSAEPAIPTLPFFTCLIPAQHLSRLSVKLHLPGFTPLCTSPHTLTPPAKCGLEPVTLPRLGSKKSVASVLGALSFSHSLALREASCCVACCPHGKGLMSLANSQGGPEVWQQQHE